MKIGLVDILRLVAVGQFSFLALVLPFLSKERKMRNTCLSVFLISKALFLVDILLITLYRSLPDSAHHFMNIGSSFQFAIGPALFFSMIVSTRKEFAFKPRHLVHLIPLLASLGLMAVEYLGYGIEMKKTLIESGFPYHEAWFPWWSRIIYPQFLAYGIASLVVLFRCRRNAPEYLSEPVNRNIAYLVFIICDFIVFWGVNTFNWQWGGPLIDPGVLDLLTVLNLFVVANTIVYQGMKVPGVAVDERVNRIKYEKNLLTDEEKKRYTDKLIGHMQEKKPYLNPALSLSDLAGQLAVPAHILSQVLNVSLNQNFYDFVNKYRVNESKNMLLMQADNGPTIMEILYQSGFNSKSAFNAAFKKHAGLTPREFRRCSIPGASAEVPADSMS